METHHFQRLPHLKYGKKVCFREPMTVCAPKDLLRRAKFQNLANNIFLPLLAKRWEDLANIDIDIVVDARKISSLFGPRVARMKKDDGNIWIRSNEILEVRW